MIEIPYLRRHPEQTVSFPGDDGIGLIKGYAFKDIPSEVTIIYSMQGSYFLQNPPSGWNEDMLDDILLNKEDSTKKVQKIKSPSCMITLAMKSLGYQFMEETRRNYLLHGETALMLSPQQIYVGKPGLIITALKKEHDISLIEDDKTISAFIEKYTNPVWKKPNSGQH